MKVQFSIRKEFYVNLNTIPYCSFCFESPTRLETIWAYVEVVTLVTHSINLFIAFSLTSVISCSAIKS